MDGVISYVIKCENRFQTILTETVLRKILGNQIYNNDCPREIDLIKIPKSVFNLQLNLIAIVKRHLEKH